MTPDTWEKYCSYVQSPTMTILIDLILEQELANPKELKAFYYCSHNSQLGEAGAAIGSNIFNLDINDEESVIVIT